jgi:hypothetical protein
MTDVFVPKGIHLLHFQSRFTHGWGLEILCNPNGGPSSKMPDRRKGMKFLSASQRLCQFFTLIFIGVIVSSGVGCTAAEFSQNKSTERGPIESSGQAEPEPSVNPTEPPIVEDESELKPNVIKRIELAVNETKTYLIEGRKGGYFELLGTDDFTNPVSVALLDKKGIDIFDGLDEIFIPTALFPEDGTYRLQISISKYQYEEIPPGKKVAVSFGYKDSFEIPKGSKLNKSKKLGEYDLKIWTATELSTTIFEMRRGRELKAVLIGTSPAAFQIVGDASLWRELSASERRSISRITDKTGDGVPDVILEFFSGGAHCCFSYITFELGKEVKRRPTLDVGHSGVSGTTASDPKRFGLKIYDWNFAYWNTSFAESPAPEVFLVFDSKTGDWRPDFPRMRKPAPSARDLERKAFNARKKMDLEPYTGEDSIRFEDAFWGEMLDLIYAGNETLAWNYFDSVWPKDKPGKAVFRKDFEKKLGESRWLNKSLKK